MKKPILLLPIETLNRELDYKLILGHALADKFRVFIGSVTAIHSLKKHFKGGVYFGKTIFSSKSQKINKTNYEDFRKNNFRIVYLHEEGAVWYGDKQDWAKQLAHQYDISIFNDDDHVCVWGRTQKELESKRNVNNVPISVTGHPKFELTSKYAGLYTKGVHQLKARFGNFILINGNFGAFNHGAGFYKNLKYASKRNQDYLSNLKQYMNVYISVGNRMYRMIELALVVSKKFPNTNFIYRPHPSENTEVYNDFFRDIQNVFVIKKGSVNNFIIASAGLVHDGCTTALEAGLAGKPVLNYKKIRDDFDIYLPNQTGVQTANITEAMDIIGSMIKGQFNAKLNQYEGKALGLLENLNNNNSIKKLKGIIETMEFDDRVTTHAPNTVTIRSWFLRKIIKVKLSFIKNRVMGRTNEIRHNRYLINKFSGFERNTVQEMIDYLDNEEHKKSELKFHNKELCEITNN